MGDIVFHIGVDIKKWLGVGLRDPETPLKQLLDKEKQSELMQTGRIATDSDAYDITPEIYEKGVVYHFGTHPSAPGPMDTDSYSEGCIIVGPEEIGVHYIITGISDRFGPFGTITSDTNSPEWKEAALAVYQNMAAKAYLVSKLGPKIDTSLVFANTEKENTRNPIKMIRNNAGRQNELDERHKQESLFGKAISESFARIAEAYKLRKVDGAYVDYFEEEQKDKSR